MFKGFQDTSRSQLFKGFPNLNFQINNEAYGFSGCTFWLDAAYGLNTQVDLAAVSSWIDRIKNIKFIQATAGNQPRLIVSSPSYNNNPVINFNTSTRFLASNINISSFATIAIVANYDTLGGRNCVLGNAISAEDNLLSLGGTVTGFNGVTIGTGGNAIASGTTEDTTVKIAIINKTNIYVNGLSEYSGNTQIQHKYFRFVGQWVNGSNALIGSVAEIILFDSHLTNDQCVALSDRLNSKYAIY
jgi:hypothetical protein